jgi:virginiamycin B lyase
MITRRRSRLVKLLASTVATMAVLARPAVAAPLVTEFPIPTAAAVPQDIVQGPDGKLWFAESGADKVGRIDPANPTVVEEFPTKDKDGGPFGITVGPDGNIWFTERDDKEIGMMPPGNPAAVQEFAVGGVIDNPQGIAPGLDGNLWVVSAGNEKVVRVSTAGVKVEEIPIPGFGGRFIAPGPGNTMWVAGFGGKVGRIAGTGGAVTAFDVTSAWDIVQGPDGNMWFTAPNTHVGRITPAGVVTEFPTPTAASDPFGIALGPDGAIWFAQALGNNIGRATTAPVFNEIGGLTTASRPEYITTGPGDTMWFTEKDGNRVGRISGIDLPGAGDGGGTPPPPPPPPDTQKPSITRLGLSKATFGSGKGTVFRFTLSEAATVRFTIQRAKPGRRVNGRCVKPRRALRHRPRCIREYRTVGSFARAGAAGRNAVTFDGRIARRKLAAGIYKVVMTATDAAGNRSAATRAPFTVVKPLKARKRG